MTSIALDALGPITLETLVRVLVGRQLRWQIINAMVLVSRVDAHPFGEGGVHVDELKNLR